MADEPASKRQKSTDLFSDDFCEEIILEKPEQRVFNGVRTPMVLMWISEDKSLSAATNWITERFDWLQAHLLKHGGILFRGFPVKAATDFDAFVSSFSAWEDLSYADSLSYAVRLPVVGRVCTTNEGKTGGMVFHHEQAQTPKWPSKLFFFCERPATTGGGTGICPSDAVYLELEKHFPDFIKDCEEGVRYTALLRAEADPSIGVGRGWKSFFGKETKEEVEERMKELGYSWEWVVGEDGTEVLKSTSPVLPAVRTAPGTDRKVFFNQIVAMIANAQEFAERSGASEINIGRFLHFANGHPVDVDILRAAKRICDDLAVELNWQAGDVALLDNYLVMHARRAFDGPRRVLASLVK